MKAMIFTTTGHGRAPARPWPPGLVRLLGAALAVLLGWLALPAYAQPTRVLSARYWFDAGAKTTMTAADGAFDQALETAVGSAVSVLGAGTHSLNIEVQGEDGQFGPVSTSALTVFAPQAARIVRIQSGEVQLGASAPVAVVATDGAFDEAVEGVVRAALASGAALGPQTLKIRLRGEDGQFGPDFTSVLTVVAPLTARIVRIQSGEVQLGASAPVPVVATDGAFDEAVEEVVRAALASGVVVGPLTLKIRLRGEDGQFGPDFTSVLTVVAPLSARVVRIQSGEVQLGAGAPVPVVATDGAFDEAVEEVVRAALASGVIVGPLTLKIRLRGEDGQFGPDFTSVLTVISPLVARNVRILSGEVQLGANPAVAVVATDGSFDEAVEEVVRAALAAGVTTGPQTLKVRLMGDDGQFGPDFTSVLSVVPPMTARLVRIQQGRMWWDADLANAVAMLIVNGNLNPAVATANGVLPLGSLVPGPHALRVQLMGDDGQWGNTFTSAVTVTPCTAPATPVASATATTIFVGQTISLSATVVAGATYEWRGPNTFASTLRTPSITNAQLVATGTYWVRTIGPGPDFCPSPEDSVNVTVLPPVTITTDAVAPTSLCAGVSFNVGYNVTSGTLNAGNQFRVQLSDNNGDFTAATVIGGPVTSTATSGSIPVTIPAGSPTGTQYRIRVVASSPVTNGVNNGAALTITTPFAATATASPTTVLAGGTISFGVTGAPTGATYAWTGPNAFSSASATPSITSATPAATGTYNLTVTKGGCTSSSSVAVSVVDCSTNLAAGQPLAFYAGGNGATAAQAQTLFNGGSFTDVSGTSTSNQNHWTVTLPQASTVGQLSYTYRRPTTSVVWTGRYLRVQLSTDGTNFFDIDEVDPMVLPVNTTVALNRSFAPVANVVKVRFRMLAYGNFTVSNFIVGACAGPYISSFSPTSGPAGTSVTLTGANLTGAAAVAFAGQAFALGATPAPGFAVNGAGTQITVNAPAGGFNGLIQVTTPSGVIYTGAGYQYPNRIVVNSLSSTTLCNGQGLNINFTAFGIYAAPGSGGSNTFRAQLLDSLDNVVFTLTNVTPAPVVNEYTGTITVPGLFIPTTLPTGNNYHIRVDATNPVTTGAPGTQALTILNLSAAVATSNSPVSVGGTIQLDVPGLRYSGSNTYAWTKNGSGYSSSLRNPTIPNAQTSDGGTYRVTITRGSCSTTKTVTVTVNTVPSAVTTSNISPTTYCAGGTISVPFTVSGGSFNVGNVFTAQLLDSLGTVLGTIGTLSGITDGTISGTVPAAAPYSVHDRVRVIASSPATTGSQNAQDLTIINLNGATATSNSPVSQGATVLFNVAGMAAASLNTYTWSKISGGGTFSSGLQNPTILGATTANSGTYQVVISRGSCSVTRTVPVTVNPVPGTVTGTGPISPTGFCAGSAISVPFSTTDTFTSGNVFTAQLSNASGSFASGVQTLGSVTSTTAGTISGTIPVGTPAGTGYLVRVIASNPASTGPDNGAALTITAPFTVSTAPTQFVAAGGTISLSVTGAPTGATYAWTGPSFTSASATPTLSPATTAMTGTYSVTVSKGGCSTTTSTYVRVYDCATANLAAGLPTANYFASSTFNGSAQNVFNGGQWNGGGFAPRFVGVDFGVPVSFNAVTLQTNMAPGGAVNHEFETSNDLTTWTPVSTFNGSISSGVTIFRSFAPVTARALRILTTASPSWVAWDNIRVSNCAPYITSFTPATGPAGTSVVLTGGNFTGATGVAFNGTAAPGFAVNGAGTTVTVNAPATGSTGLLTVTTANGTATSLTAYTYQLAIAAGTISPTTYCTGGAIAVPFTVTGGTYNAGNVFTAQLVDSLGSVLGNIGTLSGTGSGTISGNIPTSAPYSVQDRVRIVSSNPATTSAVSAANLTVIQLSGATATSNSPVSVGSAILFDVTGVPAASLNTYTWSKISGGGTFSSSLRNPTIAGATVANSGTYQVVVSRGTCSVTRTVGVTVDPAITGLFGNTVQMNGSTDYIDVPTSAATNLGTSDFTVEAWFKTNSFPSVNGAKMLNKGLTGSGSPANAGYGLRLLAPGTLRFEVSNGTPQIASVSGLSTGTWYHVAGVRQGNTVTLYLNGSPVSTVTGATTANVNTNIRLVLGALSRQPASSSTSEFYNGLLDEVRIWNVARTVGQIQADLNQELAGTETGLVAYWDMNRTGQGAGLTVTNGATATGTALDGTTFGTATTPIFTPANNGGGPVTPTITTGTISPTTYCAGAPISVPFTVGGGAFNAGNVFTAQLVDSVGTVIGTVGTLTGTTGGTINGTVPSGAPYAVQDRIRVVGSNPATVGTLNGQNLTIIQLSGAAATSNSPITAGATLTFDVTDVPAASLNTYTWSKISGGGTFSSSLRNPTIASATTANSGTYQVVVSRGSCSVTRTVSVTVNPATAITQVGTINPATTCPGNSVSVQFFVSGTFATGNVFTAQLIDSLGTVVGNIGTAGTIGGMTSGQTNGAYPVGAAYGENYRIRVVSSNPALTSPLSSDVVRVYNLNPATAISNSPVAFNSTIQLDVATVGFASSNTYQWTKISGGGSFSSSLQNPQILNATTANAGTYQVVISRGVCSVTRTVVVTVSGVPTIATGAISPLSYCAGTTISIPFTVTGGAFSAGNVFTAELSGTGGLFTVGTITVLGTLNGTTSGTITGTIPTTGAIQNSPTYRIRVIASAPGQTGTDNGADIRITNLELATAQTNAPIAAGNTLSVSVFGTPFGATYVWTGPVGTTITNANTSSASVLNAQPSNSGTYQVVVTANGCTVTRTISVTITPGAPTASITTTGPASGTYCAGSPIFVDFTTTGVFAANNVFTAQLSNASGSFAAPITIGTVNGPGTGTGQIGGPIPAGTPSGTGYLVRIISSNPNLIGSVSGPLTISGTSFTWVGTANSNWNDPANWSCGVVPGQNDDVTINPGGFSPIVGVGGGIVRSITINLNATITVNSTFTVWGNVVNNGTIGAGIGSGWVWAGGGAWTVGGTGTYNFWNITVNNSVNLTVNTTWTVRGNVLNNGGLVQGYQYFLYLPGTSSFGGNPMTWGTYYVQGTGNVSWNIGLSAWGIYNNGGTINPGTSGFTFVGGAGIPAGTIGGVGSSAIPFYAVTFNNPLGITQAADISIANFWTNNYVFNPGTRQVRFTGPAQIGGIGSVVFYDLWIDATVTLNVDIIIRGDLRNDGLFNCGIRRVIFDGTTQQIYGSAAFTNFYHVQFNNTVNLTLNQHIVVDGDWLNNGTFVGLGYYVLFSGGLAQTVGGPGSTRFGDVRWHNVSAGGVTLGGPIRVGGNFSYLGGNWNAAGFGVTFDGTATQAINGPLVPVFAGLVNNNSSVTGLTLGVNVRGTGNWSGTGRFCGCGFETWFSGVAQTIGGPGRWDFHHVRITSSTSLTLNVNIHVYGDWFLNGVFVPGLFTVFFDGLAGQLIYGPVVTNFYHLTINNLVNVTLNQTIRVRGNFGGVGVLIGTGWFTIFDGASGQTITTGAGTRFGHLTFNNASGVGLLSGIGLTGNFLNTNGFGSGGFTTGFYGTGTQTISGGGIVFGNAYTAPGATASLNVPVSFTGSLTNDGAWLANLHTCTFTGTGTIGGLNIPLFYHLHINGTVTLAVFINLTGDIRINGTFNPAICRVIFGGTLPQRIYGTAAIFNFYDITVNNLAVVNIEVDIHIRHDLVNDGTINWPICRVVFFDGSTLQSIGGSTVTRFCGITVNNPGGTVTLAQNIRCSGDFRDQGGWRAGGFLTTFDGSAGQGLYGLIGGGTSFGGLTFNNASGGGATLFGPIALTGDFRNTAGFNHGGFGVTFGGSGATQNVYGPSQLIFHHLIIDVAATVQLNLDIRLTGNWTNRNVFLPNGWTVWFIGTVAQTINGPAVTNFYHITINNTVSVSLTANIRIRGNFIDNGVFCGCGFLTTFDGIAPQTITCNSGNTRFHDITFANNTGVTLINAIGVTGNWLNNGGFNAGGQLVLFAGTGGQTIGGSALTTFHDWRNTNNSTAGVSLIRDAAWTGNWTNDGRFCGCGFLSSFVGTTAQVITCNTLQSAFHHITLSNTSTGGVRLAGDIGVTGNWHVTGLFFPVTFTVHFTGTVAQTITRGGSMLHCQFYGIRITNPVGVNLGANCPLYFSGPFTNNGVFGYNGNGAWANGGTGGNGSGGNGAGGHLGGGGAAGGGGGSGSGAQACSGTAPTTFGNWTLQNPNGANCSGPGYFGIQQVLTMAPGSGNLACGNAVTLLSNATGTGMIVNTPTGGVCTGLGTMIRFVNSGSLLPGYRHYATPMKVGTSTVNEFADDLPVFNINPAFNTAPVPNSVTPFPTLFLYDDAHIPAATPTFDRGWMVPASTTTALIPGKGYSAQTNANTVVDITGTFQTGAVATPALTRGAFPASGWNLVGNPYPAPMDWRLVTKPTAVDNAIYLHKPTGRYTGTYASWVNNVAQNGGDPVLSSMQGFFVRVNAPGTAALTFTDAARLTTWTNPTFWRPAAPATETRPLLRLVVTAPATGKADEAVVYFEAGATRSFDRAFDASKPLISGGGYPTVWSVSTGPTGPESLAISGLPETDLTNGTVIPLAVRVPADGQYRLTARQLLNLPAGAPVWLEDRQLGTVTNLAVDSVYSFAMLAASTTPRFFLNIGRGVPTGISAAFDPAATRLAVYPNPTQADVTVRLEGLPAGFGALTATLVDALGRDVLTATLRPELGTAEGVLDLHTLPQGVYTLRLKPTTPATGVTTPGWTRKVVIGR